LRGFFVLFASLFALLLWPFTGLSAQDTVYVSKAEFVRKAIEHSAFLRLRAQEVAAAENRAKQAAASRFLPKLDLITSHGVVPGIRTDSSRSRAFLDPNLQNDWSRWGIFTRAELQGAQPLFTWGAISKGVEAAHQAAVSNSYDFENRKAEFTVRLLELYHAKQLEIRLRGVLRNADEQFEKAEKTLKRMQDEGEDVEQSQIYRFRISRLQFQQQRLEFDERMDAVNRVWLAALGLEKTQTVVVPLEQELKPIADSLGSFEQYKELALVSRPDLKSVRALRGAAESQYKSRKAQQFPALFLGFGGEFVTSPRPIQQQPLLGDRYTYANIYYTIGFRQSLNFNVTRYDVNRTLIDLKRAKEGEDALKENILLEVAESYRQVRTLNGKSQSSAQALQISKEWVRMEQIDYDLGVGDLNKLVDAVRMNLELDAETAKLLFELNVEYARFQRTLGTLDIYLTR
jgi:outer membrane protein TolC